MTPIRLPLIFLLLFISSSCVLSAVTVESYSHSDDSNRRSYHNDGEEEKECKAWLVQSIPTDMPQLHLVPGVLSTGNFPFSPFCNGLF